MFYGINVKGKTNIRQLKKLADKKGITIWKDKKDKVKSCTLISYANRAWIKEIAFFGLDINEIEYCERITIKRLKEIMEKMKDKQ